MFFCLFVYETQEADEQLTKALEHNAAAGDCYILRAKLRQQNKVCHNFSVFIKYTDVGAIRLTSSIFII
jgi:hypothetical protein